MTNGEKYKTAQKRAKAFRDCCKIEIEDGCLTCPLRNCTKGMQDCAFAWLDREAKEEKPFPCPFCGSELDVSKAVNTKSYGIHCGCGYYAPWKHTKHDAIATHNRVAKKCMEGK